MEKIVDLTEIAGGRTRMLAGAQRGLAARELLRLDSAEKQRARIVVRAPDQLQTIASSFVQALLGKTYSDHGAEGIREFYDFSQLKPSLQEDFERGIHRLRLNSEQIKD